MQCCVRAEMNVYQIFPALPMCACYWTGEASVRAQPSNEHDIFDISDGLRSASGTKSLCRRWLSSVHDVPHLAGGSL